MQLQWMNGDPGDLPLSPFGPVNFAKHHKDVTGIIAYLMHFYHMMTFLFVSLVNLFIPLISLITIQSCIDGILSVAKAVGCSQNVPVSQK